MKTFHIKISGRGSHRVRNLSVRAVSQRPRGISNPYANYEKQKMMKSSNHHIFYIYPALEQRLHLLLDRKGLPSLKIPREEIMTDNIVINHRFERAVPHVIDLF